ncbi:uncharacterized protein [Diadema antillarum]|uniref:uncharacterized protein isoform X3 n=1 Tax=Diadema antillarum TaxID=105358 RepID=UPI003A855EAA
MAKGIRALLETVFLALPQVGNLGLLFFLLFFIFAALGVELFGRLDCTEDNPCEGLGRHASFKHFFIAFLTLFRIATGDNWNGIMKDTLRKDNCDKSSGCQTNCCANPYLAPMYFFSFVLIAQFVLVNVVVAVLMKHLEESHKLEQDDEEDAQIIADQLRQDALDAAAASEQEREDGSNISDEGVATSNPEMSLPKGDKKSAKSNNPSQLLVVKQPVSRVKSLPDNFQLCADKGAQDPNSGVPDTQPSEEQVDGDQSLPVPQLYLKASDEKSIAGQQTTSAESMLSSPGAKGGTSSPALSSSSLGAGLLVPSRDSEREGSPNPQRKFAAAQLNPSDRTNTCGADASTAGHDGQSAGVAAGGEEVPLQEWRVQPVVQVSSTSSEDDLHKNGGVLKVHPDSPVKRAQRMRNSPAHQPSPKKLNHAGLKNNNGDSKRQADSLLSVESGCSSDNDSLASSPQIRQRNTNRRNRASSNSSSGSPSPQLQRNAACPSKQEGGLRAPAQTLPKGHSNPLLWEPNGQTNGSQGVRNGAQNGSPVTPTVHVEPSDNQASQDQCV